VSSDRIKTIMESFRNNIMTYNGLENCIVNNQSYENESRTSRAGDECVTDSLDNSGSSCSSSKDIVTGGCKGTI